MTITPEEAAAEEARAQLWRAQQSRRVQYQTQLWRSLAGAPGAIQALRARWSPVTNWLAERDEPGVDPEVEVDPLGISDTVNIGE